MFRAILFSILLFLGSLANADCHPSIDTQQRQFVIGYGSLLETNSKNHTYAHTGANMPVIVKGYTRGWYIHAKHPKLNATYLGVVPARRGHFNGAYFELFNRNAIKHYDRREMVYCRKEVKRKDIVVYNHRLPQGQYWIYYSANNQVKLPTVSAPIIQSYVDVFINGCLEIEKKYHLKNFAQQCILTTKAWSKHWVKDSVFPRGPYKHQPNARVIDKLLQKNIPEFFN